MSMSQKSVAKAKADASAKVVVFGLDSNWRPRAAWFPHTQAGPARAAAKQLHLNVIEVANGRAADLVGNSRLAKSMRPAQQWSSQSEKICMRKSSPPSIRTVKPVTTRASQSHPISPALIGTPSSQATLSSPKIV
jgi:hypothetical protein